MTAASARCATETDEELMGRVAKGDVRAFEAVYDRYHRRAYSLARRITGGAGGAEEATQDAFLSLWRGASSFDPKRAGLATWLHTLVRYRSIDGLRRGSARPLHQCFTERAAERIEAPERTEDQVFAIQDYDRALRLVAELPPEQREVINLAYFAGYTQTEIAARVGIPLGTVKGRVRLGLLKLRHAAECESAAVAAA
jgi:RNA polymerase sigma-70 factor (ECF subfamily)